MMDKQKPQVTITTDGACRKNPGPGGWAAILRFNKVEKIVTGGDPDTTNNRMELMAAIGGLCALKVPCQVKVYTDSKYLINGMTRWLSSWKRSGWQSSTGGPVKNQDLWEELDQECSKHDVEFFWVKAHSGNGFNEKADYHARKAIRRFSRGSQ